MTGIALDPWITIDDYDMVVEAIGIIQRTREGNLTVALRTDYCTSYGRGANPDALLPPNFTIGRTNADAFWAALPVGQFVPCGNNTWVNRSILVGSRHNHLIGAGPGTDYRNFILPEAAPNLTCLDVGGNDARTLRAQRAWRQDAGLLRGVGTGTRGTTITNAPTNAPTTVPTTSPPTKAKTKRVMSAATKAKLRRAAKANAAKRRAAQKTGGKTMAATA